MPRKDHHYSVDGEDQTSAGVPRWERCRAKRGGGRHGEADQRKTAQGARPDLAADEAAGGGRALERSITLWSRPPGPLSELLDAIFIRISLSLGSSTDPQDRTARGRLPQG